MSIEIHHLLDHAHHLPTVAAWQHAEFGYLSPGSSEEQRAERLRTASDRARLPIVLLAISGGHLVGSAAVSASTLTHKHLTPWLSSVFVPPELRGKGTGFEACAGGDRRGRSPRLRKTPSFHTEE